MNKKTTGILAGAAGAALLIGGGTFALWNDSATATGGAITTGNLEIVASETPVAWIDSSDDRTDEGHAINLASWKGSPGDSVTGTFNFQAALDGDNLVAALTPTAVTGAPAAGSPAWYTVDTQVEYLVGSTWTAVTAPGEVQTFASVNNTGNVAPSTVLPTLPATASADNVRVKVTVTIAENAPNIDRVNTASTITLSDVAVGLQQTRTAGVGGGF